MMLAMRQRTITKSKKGLETMEWSRCRSQPQQAQQTWATRKQHDMRQRQQGGQEHELHLHYPETTGDDKCVYLHVQVNPLCSMHWTRTWRATQRLCHWILEWRLFSSEANYGFSVRVCFPLPKSTGCISHIHLRKWQECNHMKKQAKKICSVYLHPWRGPSNFDLFVSLRAPSCW